jgi:hypothetical protein
LLARTARNGFSKPPQPGESAQDKFTLLRRHGGAISTDPAIERRLRDTLLEKCLADNHKATIGRPEGAYEFAPVDSQVKSLATRSPVLSDFGYAVAHVNALGEEDDVFGDIRGVIRDALQFAGDDQEVERAANRRRIALHHVG